MEIKIEITNKDGTKIVRTVRSGRKVLEPSDCIKSRTEAARQ